MFLLVETYTTEDWFLPFFFVVAAIIRVSCVRGVERRGGVAARQWSESGTAEDPTAACGGNALICRKALKTSAFRGNFENAMF